MTRDFTWRKNSILVVLGLLIVADVAMAVYSARMASSKSSPQQELGAQAVQLKLLRADVERARGIQRDMPKTRDDCERFEESLPSGETGYSTVAAELAEVGHKAGLQIGSLSFRPKELAGRGMTEVLLDATVTGNYKSVVRFLNELQRSKNHYVVDNLTLATEAAGQGGQGAVKVALHLKSYFKGRA